MAANTLLAGTGHFETTHSKHLVDGFPRILFESFFIVPNGIYECVFLNIYRRATSVHNKRPVVLSSVGFELIADCQQATSPAIWRSAVSFPHGHRRGWWVVDRRVPTREPGRLWEPSTFTESCVSCRYVLLIKVLQEQLIISDAPRVLRYFLLENVLFQSFQRKTFLEGIADILNQQSQLKIIHLIFEINKI